MKRRIIWLIVIVSLFGIGYWAYRQATKPLPGVYVADLGRQHVPDGTKVDYNSNPPTSGPHWEDWVRPGVYDAPQPDGKLVHSLEHGYIIISYNLDGDAAKDLVAKLTSIYESKGKKKLIIVPRPNLDSKIALTAWRRIDKFSDFDEARIIKFIDAFRDHGPEQTME